MSIADLLGGGNGPLHLTGALGVVVAVVGVWQSGRVANWVRDGVLRSTEIDHELAPFARQTTRVLFIVLSVALGMMLAGVGTSGLVAFLSASGLGVTLALQSMLLNIASGVALLMFRPFKSNDEIEAAGVAGRVQAIKLMSTELRTADNVHVSLPNSKVWGSEIRNFSTEPVRRLDTLLTIPNAVELDDAIRLLVRIAGDVAGAPPERRETSREGSVSVTQTEGPQVTVQEIKETTTVLRLRIWCKAAAVDELRTRLLTESRRALASLPGWRQHPAKAEPG